MGELLLGKELAQAIKFDLRRELGSLGPQAAGLKLCAVLIGDDSQARLYSQLQQRVAATLGIAYVPYVLPADITEQAAIREIEQLNKDAGITGIILQRPLPAHLDPRNLINHIHAFKDV